MSAAVAPAVQRPAWSVVVGVMLTALLEVLDTTVVNVALPHMMGSFGATPDQITWMITAYLVSTAIVMPLTGYLVGRFGRRLVLFSGVAGFLATSAACGLSWSLASMVLFRFFQGAFGAVLVPISQSILLDAFPREKRGQAMAIWGLAIMVGPVLGPVIGGYITEYWSWRWVFFINVPLGAIAIVLMLDEVGGAPARRDVATDWGGLVLLSVALGAFQTLLDQGHTRDWFDSGFIWILAWLAGSAFALFVVRALGREHNIVDIRLFTDRNFTAGNLLMAGYGLAMYSTIVMWPLLAQDVMGYPADTAGWVLAPRGTVSAVMMIVIGTFVASRVDGRWLIMAGMLISAFASSLMARLSLDADMFALTQPGLVLGLGMALVFSPLSTATFETIPSDKGADAAGLYNVMRTMGGSIGIALTSTFLVRREQVHWHRLGEHVSATNPRVYDWLERTDIALDEPDAPVKLAAELFRHVQMGAFNDVFWAICAVFVVLTPCVLLLGRRRAVA
ncbi:MAG: DHA2 family efflux MFS transporter permease subunit [Gammaproteobacteria bacterium]